MQNACIVRMKDGLLNIHRSLVSSDKLARSCAEVPQRQKTRQRFYD
jgi:hypothetical protein